jgi:hypothetical protein
LAELKFSNFILERKENDYF